MKKLLLFLLLPVLGRGQEFTPEEVSRYQAAARRVTIVRDNWGVPHIYGKTDADAVFGLMYAQCEENFPRLERNYLEVMGLLARLDGEGRLYSDLQMQLIYDSTAAIADYKRAPASFRKLLNAFADGINYYLYLHPEVKPAVLTRFRPWYALMLTNGSISATQMGGITLQDTRSLYAIPEGKTTAQAGPDEVFTRFLPTGSNGFALAPSRTASGNAMLYINPHVTFYFRSEVQMVSEEGLNAYGAVTWGNFFVYQGFNEHCGWMHTSSYADVADLYEETIVQQGDSLYYHYEKGLRPVRKKTVLLQYKKGPDMAVLPVTAYYTHHGPVMGSRDGKWLSLRERNRSLDALMQSWLRTKAKSFSDFRKAMNLRSNNSDNTVYADAAGNIAYWHGNFLPIRDTMFNWSQPLNGAIRATEWKGVHRLEDIIQVRNPATGWIQNCNSTPFTASGSSSPKREDYPGYMGPDGQNFRALNAVRLLSAAKEVTLDGLIAIGYDRYLAAFDVLLPSLFSAYAELPGSDTLKAILQEPVALLRSWDKHSSVSSVPATLAIEWGYRLLPLAPRPRSVEEATNAVIRMNAIAQSVPARDKLRQLVTVLRELEAKYGTWQVAWGERNRYQRPPGLTAARFNDSLPSLPSGLASSAWGSLPAYEGRTFPEVTHRYGTSGNSFVAAVEFGKRLKARSVITGGQSFDHASPHFTDQARNFLEGKFKDVLFYREDVLKHAQKTYHPGEE